MNKSVRIMYYITTAISALVGLWHFFVPKMFHWYDYLPMQYENLIVGIDYTNYCFSLLLFGLSGLLIFLGKKALELNKEVLWFYYFLTVVWVFRACLATLIEPWPLEPIPAAAIGQMAASNLIAVMMIIVCICFIRKINSVKIENRQKILSTPWWAYMIMCVLIVLFAVLGFRCDNDFCANMFYAIIGSLIVSVMIDLGNTKMEDNKEKWYSEKFLSALRRCCALFPEKMIFAFQCGLYPKETDKDEMPKTYDFTLKKIIEVLKQEYRIPSTEDECYYQMNAGFVIKSLRSEIHEMSKEASLLFEIAKGRENKYLEVKLKDIKELISTLEYILNCLDKLDSLSETDEFYEARVNYIINTNMSILTMNFETNVDRLFPELNIIP